MSAALFFPLLTIEQSNIGIIYVVRKDTLDGSRLSANGQVLAELMTLMFAGGGMSVKLGLSESDLFFNF